MTEQLVGELYRFELKFKEPAMTSRGTYLTHTVWYPVLKGQGKFALGECAPLPDLSADFLAQGADEAARMAGYEQLVERSFETLWRKLKLGEQPDFEQVRSYSSVRFGLECLYQMYRAPSGNAALLWPSDFTRGKCDLPINGLIWMGSFEEMAQRIAHKLHEGYHCIKLKIGAIDFERELELLRQLRGRFSPEELELRVDANGAFAPAEVEAKLAALSQFSLHSIEQPIKAGQPELMAQLCAASPIAIGLDEELIGVNDRADKATLLDTIKPHYLILKPSLHGGLGGCAEWMQLARARGIAYWVTSALESNLGLNALAQWCATQDITMPQGLGTGLLYTNNLVSPLMIRAAQLHCDLSAVPDYAAYLAQFLAHQAQLVARFEA